MPIVEGVVEKVYVNEPKVGKYGTFYPQSLVVNGLQYTKNTPDNTPIASPGDQVKFLCEEKNGTKEGTVFRNIVSGKGAFEVVSKGHNVSAGQTQISVDPTTKAVTAQLTTGLTDKNARIARMNAVTSAVELVKLSGNFKGASTQTILQEVEETAKKITAYTLG